MSSLRVPVIRKETGETEQVNLFCLWNDGTFAICQHHNLADCLSVSHVPTGYVITECESVSDGRHFIEALERAAIDWNFADEEAGRQYAPLALTIIEEIHEQAEAIAARTVAMLLASGKPIPDNWEVI